MSGFTSRLRQLWAGLRTLLGDDAYERYVNHCRVCHPDRMPLDRRAFYADELDRRWQQVNRCC